MLDEAAGRGRTEGVGQVTGRLLDEQALLELGHQLGYGLASGASEITPELEADLSHAVEEVLAVAFARAAKGVRDDLSPELREMVRQDIVRALAEGMRGDVGASLEETVARVIDRTVAALLEGIRDPELRDATAALVRDAMWQAMREGRPGSPGVGETLEMTLSENLLIPFETSIGTLAETVADRVDESARRTERTLQGVISALVLILGVILLMYAITRRQLNRERSQAQAATQELRSVGAALGELEPEARARLLGKLDEFHRVHGKGGSDLLQAKSAQPPERSTDYIRDDR
jgi:VIT1/CCC1 family predicted Fe2+/Mn2+ transporter